MKRSHDAGGVAEQSTTPTLFGEARMASLPNKRLKLAGGDRFEGNGVLCGGAHEPSFNDTARGGPVARSLSAIR